MAETASLVVGSKADKDALCRDAQQMVSYYDGLKKNMKVNKNNCFGFFVRLLTEVSPKHSIFTFVISYRIQTFYKSICTHMYTHWFFDQELIVYCH